MYRTCPRPCVRRSADRQGAPSAPVPVEQSTWGSSTGHAPVSHCISTLSTPFLFLASRSPFGPGCSCRQMSQGRGEHGVLAPTTRSLSGSRPEPAFLLVGLHRYRLVVMPTTRMMQSTSGESSPSNRSSRRGALLLRGILRIARSLFEHLVDERCTRPVLVHE